MEYYIADHNNQQAGPFSLEELKSKNIKKTTKVWKKGMQDWVDAGTVYELQSILTDTPSIVQPNYNNSSGSYNQNYSTPTLPFHIYEEYFDANTLSAEEKNYCKNHRFFEEFNPVLAIVLHFVTCGIFTMIFCGLKHSNLPRLKHDDFEGGKAIGFLFIPFFNFYWVFVFWRRLAMRINLQFKLRNEQPPVSLALATTVCIFIFIPYIGAIINSLILLPILLYQIQTASNRLANENIGRNQYSANV